MNTPFFSLRPILAATRTAVLSLVAIAGLAAATPAQAQQAPSPVRLTQVDHENLRLRIDNPSQQASRVEVIHLNTGQPLFTESYADAAYGHRFNFHGLPTGRYAMLLKVGPDRYKYTIQVADGPEGQTVAVAELATRQLTPALASAAR